MVKEAVAVTIAFGNECNSFVDIIQQALDTALGSSGNLLPDKPVVSALEALRISVERRGLTPLLQLLEPLSVILTSAEAAGRTLSQSDTLLVQEAIVAITLGIDSLVNKKPMPELIADVTGRVTVVAVDGKHRLRGDAESAGLVDVFVEEAEELLHRLFELIQRWRGAPHGGSKLHSDISRLLHTLKGSADTVGLSDVAELAHHLESVLVGLKHHHGTPRGDTFELILEAIEVLSDDVDSIRNNERITEHRELIEKLFQLAESSGSGGLPANRSIEPRLTEATQQPDPGATQAAPVVVSEAVHEGAERTPVFGSARYFMALETSQRMLRKNHSEYCLFHDELRQQLGELSSVLHNAMHVRKNLSEPENPLLYKAIDESNLDIGKVKNGLEELLLRADGIVGRQSIAIDGLSSLVSTADTIAVESLRVRLDSIVSQTAKQAGKLVGFELFGADLSIERRLYSDLINPLEQLLSNAVVHGIEGNDQRRATGKGLEGKIKVIFKEVDRHLLVEVEDDGGGIDISALRQSVSQGAQTDVAQVSDRELLKHLIRQGVSTSPAADRASGRGVGLDIVRDSVYRHRGTMELITTPGAGTLFRLALPLSAVSKDVMIIGDAGQHYAVSCSDIVAIQGGDAAAVNLQALLGRQGYRSKVDAPVLKCRIESREFYIRVDSVWGRKMLEFTPAGALLLGSRHYKGAALLDGGKAVLHLDLAHLLKNGRVSGVSDVPVVPTVLIVDDSVTVRASFGRALVGNAYEIELARNGVEALEALERKVPDAIVLDLEMPLMDGFEVAGKIKDDPRFAAIPLIIVTSRSRDSIADWLSTAGATLFIEKPCAESRLAEAVAGVLTALPND